VRGGAGLVGEDRVESIAGLFAGERAVLLGDLFQQSLQCGHAMIPCYSTGMAEAAGGGHLSGGRLTVRLVAG
jgi:hypothetical protein